MAARNKILRWKWPNHGQFILQKKGVKVAAVTWPLKIDNHFETLWGYGLCAYNKYLLCIIYISICIVPVIEASNAEHDGHVQEQTGHLHLNLQPHRLVQFPHLT